MQNLFYPDSSGPTEQDGEPDYDPRIYTEADTRQQIEAIKLIEPTDETEQLIKSLILKEFPDSTDFDNLPNDAILSYLECNFDYEDEDYSHRTELPKLELGVNFLSKYSLMPK